MAKKVSIHPYKGYLNTEFQIYSHEQTPVEYVVYSKDNGTETPQEKKKGVVQSRNKIGVITQFEKIKHIQFPENNDEVIICVSQYENKLHVYSTFDNILLYCVFLGQMMMTISNIFIDSKIKFLIFELDNDEVHLYKLKGNKEKFSCGCKEHSDTEIRKRRKTMGEIPMMSNQLEEVKKNLGDKTKKGNLTQRTKRSRDRYIRGRR